MDKTTIKSMIVATIISGVLVLIGFVPNTNKNPQEVYRVYLKGESIGLIESKERLEQYIDTEESHLKDIYKVDKVYTPRDLDIVREITYDEKTSSPSEIYNKIKDESPFTIQGYKIIIHGVTEVSEDGGEETTEDQTIYVLDKDIFTNSVHKTAQAFIDKDELAAYENDTQPVITSTGKRIENVYIQNEVTVTSENIPVDEKIYQTEEELSKYLLFGTTEDQQTYIVKAGDTIEDVSFDNKISPEEFLIANTSFKTSSDLLYPGQRVVLGILQPQLQIVAENHIVERQVINYETKYENDPDQYEGYEVETQAGSDGIRLVTQKTKEVNGETRSVVVMTYVEEKPTIDRVVVRGTKKRAVGTPGGTIDFNTEVTMPLGSWVWPTRSPYMVTSEYAWRWGKLHAGIDISGTGYGSPIRAANNGVVITSAYTGTNGNYIYVKHANGYFTEYAHLAARYKKPGDIVYAGDVIGTMGDTGYAFGVHLHFGLWNGAPGRGGYTMNPRTLYR